MYSPAWLEPTKLIALMSGWSQMKFTAVAESDKGVLTLEVTWDCNYNCDLPLIITESSALPCISSAEKAEAQLDMFEVDSRST